MKGPQSTECHVEGSAEIGVAVRVRTCTFARRPAISPCPAPRTGALHQQ